MMNETENRTTDPNVPPLIAYRQNPEESRGAPFRLDAFSAKAVGVTETRGFLGIQRKWLHTIDLGDGEGSQMMWSYHQAGPSG